MLGDKNYNFIVSYFQAVIDAIIESESTVLFSSAELLEKNGAKISNSCGAQLTHIIYATHQNPSVSERLDKINSTVQLVSYNDLANGADTDIGFPEVVGTDLAVVMYTSGTTGKAKGTCLSS